MIAYFDDPENPGFALTAEDLARRLSEKPGLITSLVPLRPAPELAERVFETWARVGTVPLVEEVYAAVLRVLRGLDDGAVLARRVIRIFSAYRFSLSDVLALNRAVTLALGWSLPDAGVVVFVENPRTVLGGGPRMDAPSGVLLSREVEGVRVFFAVVRGGDVVVDLDTVGVVPYVRYSAEAYGDVAVKHPAQIAVEAGYSLSTTVAGSRYVVGDGPPCPRGSRPVIAPRPVARTLALPSCSLAGKR